MDIKTSSRVGKPLSAPSQERPTEATRPPHERWYVGSDVFSSTSEMLASGEDLDGKNAVYDYAFFTRDQELSEAEKKRSGRRFALVAGGIGAGLTTLIGGATVQNYMDGYGTLLQGFLETSNVNAVSEVTELISAQRAYEMNSKVIKTSDQMMGTINQIK